MSARRSVYLLGAILVGGCWLLAPAAALAQSYNTTLVETPNGRVFYTAAAGAPYVPVPEVTWYGLPAGSGPYAWPWASADVASSYYYGPGAVAVSGTVPIGSTGGTIVGGEPAAANAPAPAAATLEVRLPAKAELWIQDRKTGQTGDVRRFVSPVLEPGSSYVYRLRARWTANGQTVTREQPLMVRAGELKTVTFVAALAEARQPAHGGR